MMLSPRKENRVCPGTKPGVEGFETEPLRCEPRNRFTFRALTMKLVREETSVNPCSVSFGFYVSVQCLSCMTPKPNESTHLSLILLRPS